jgi:hypothetical protein
MTWLPRINFLFTEHLDCHIRTHNGTQRTGIALALRIRVVLYKFSWMISFQVQFFADANTPLWTSDNTKTASFAKLFVDFYETLFQRPFSIFFGPTKNDYGFYPTLSIEFQG